MTRRDQKPSAWLPRVSRFCGVKPNPPPAAVSEPAAGEQIEGDIASTGHGPRPQDVTHHGPRASSANRTGRGESFLAATRFPGRLRCPIGDFIRKREIFRIRETFRSLLRFVILRRLMTARRHGHPRSRSPPPDALRRTPGREARRHRGMKLPHQRTDRWPTLRTAAAGSAMPLCSPPRRPASVPDRRRPPPTRVGGKPPTEAWIGFAGTSLREATGIPTFTPPRWPPWPGRH